MHPQAQRVQTTLIQAGCSAVVRELPDSTRTAAEAAQAVGCEVGQIVKSLVFVLDPPGKTILLLVSGANRVNEKSVGEKLGGRLSKASAARVEAETGFVIGGVPPVGHTKPLETYIDEDLNHYEVIWAAAGTPHAVFPITPAELIRITNATPLSMR
jgi:prolyl-tRNA editing enzyme YbaK/EbsC (Cys-tRNA(Pro) deacylase)